MESETLNTLGIQNLGGKSIKRTNLSGGKIMKNFHIHTDVWHFQQEFRPYQLRNLFTISTTKGKEHAFIPGVSIIAESLAHKKPLWSNLITCLDYLKEQFYDLLRKGQFTTKWSKENRNISTNRVFQTTNKQTCSSKFCQCPPITWIVYRFSKSKFWHNLFCG